MLDILGSEGVPLMQQRDSVNRWVREIRRDGSVLSGQRKEPSFLRTLTCNLKDRC